MILIDANILVYAYIDGFPQHRTARDWLDGQLSGADRVGLPWASLLGFLRVTTNFRVLPNPPSTAEAWSQAVAWLQSGTVWIPQPTERHPAVLARLLAVPGIRANLVHNAHLAALAIEHGLSLCSADGDFARFPGLRWVNPLAG